MPDSSKSDENAPLQEGEKEKIFPLQSGIPPWHSFAFVGSMLGMTVAFLPSLEEIDDLSVASVWTNRKFPDYISLKSMAILRLGIAAVALGLTFYLAFVAEGWDVYPNYKPRSKLRRVFIRLEGIGTMCPLTSWCWFIFGLGFLTRGIVALAAAVSYEATSALALPPVWASSILDNRNLLRATLVLWELTGPFAMMVSTVVKYLIWPEILKSGKPHKLAAFRNQLQHNCNSIFSLLEVTFLGGLSVKFTHLSMATLFGCVYILFTWIMAKVYFGNKTVGPQYIYWFMDTTLEKTTTIVLAVIASVLAIFFVLFSVVVQTVLGGGIDSSPSPLLNLAFLLTGTLLVCKFK